MEEVPRFHPLMPTHLCYSRGMTTQSDSTDPAEGDFDHLQMTVCANCEGPVARRRPSMSGKHFCSKKGCRAAKSRFYYRRRAAEETITQAELDKRHREGRDALIVEFVRTVAQEARVSCSECGRADAVPGYTHPTPEWGGACNALREKPMPQNDPVNTALMVAVFPRSA